MKIISKLLILLALIFMSQFATAAESTPDCAAILSQPSQKWINDYSAKNNGSTLAITDAIATYDKCYDQKLRQILDKLSDEDRQPGMGTFGAFNDFADTMKKFMQLAMKFNATGGTYDQVNFAYAKLYFKQFRIYFYQGFQNPSAIRNDDPQKIAAAKNYLNKLIKRFPKAQADQLKAAVKNVFTNTDQVSDLKVYEYMIFLLQSPADPPYSQPPF